MPVTLLLEPARGGRVARYHDGTLWAACCSINPQAAYICGVSRMRPSAASSSKSRAWTSLGTAAASSANGQGDYASALEYANQCVRRDPLEEDGYRRPMRLDALRDILPDSGQVSGVPPQLLPSRGVDESHSIELFHGASVKPVNLPLRCLLRKLLLVSLPVPRDNGGDSSLDLS